MKSNMNSRIWIHVYEEYREIKPEIMCTKLPDDDADVSVPGTETRRVQTLP